MWRNLMQDNCRVDFALRMLNCGGLTFLNIFYYLFYCKAQTRLELALFIYKTLIDLFCAVLTGYTSTPQQRALQHL
jgi:uncharacterized protein YbbC (DUF1343 family)